jgi:long-subunit fatty acid transport protein
MKTYGWMVLGLFCFMTANAEELPFLWGHAWGVGTRATGMGGAFTAVADDENALFYNPAGLGQIKTSMLSGSMINLNSENQTLWSGSKNTERSSVSRLGSMGLALPVPTARGSLVFGFGYHRFRQFDNPLFVERFLGTANDSVTQQYRRLEEGAMSQTSIGGAVEVAPNVFLGASVNFWGGEDDYTWQFKELDQPFNLYKFSNYTSTDHFVTQFSGINLTVGGLFLLNERIRIGGVIHTPVTVKGRETFDRQDVTINDTGDSEINFEDNGINEYKIQFPWTFRVGASINQGPVMVCGDAEWIDYSQIKYMTAPPTEGTQADANLSIRENFSGRMHLRGGGEVTLTPGIAVRAGYEIIRSPYRNSSQGEDRTITSIGGSLRFSGPISLDAAMSWGSWKGYPNNSVDQENKKNRLMSFGFTYRF